MKQSTNLLLAFLMIFAFSENSEAQIWKRLKKKAEDVIVKEAEKKIDETVNGKTKKDTDKTKEIDKDSKPDETNKKTSESEIKQESLEIWRNYKFIPGEKVIFYDDLKFEEVGEFPSRWDLIKGGAEVASFNKEKVIIATAKYSNRITPLFDNKNYLSDEFTIEYDVYIDGFEKGIVSWVNYDLIFNEEGKNSHQEKKIAINMSGGKINGSANKGKFTIEEVGLGELHQWHHIALSYYKGKVKLYYDDKRILNLPNYKLSPGFVTLDFSIIKNKSKLPNPKIAIKNIRIANGGGQMYKRIVSDGKYVTNGILFDSGKASIKSQSYGIINKIVTVMNENPDWNFQIIGHTDSDGNDEINLKLSLERAESVKKAIVAQGIKAERLTAIGKGESEPLNTNSSSEEKANNRRVAFVKK